MATERLAVYRGCTPVVDERYEPDGQRTLADTVAEAVAAAEGVAPADLPPLYETVDLEALEQLFDRPDADAVFSFVFDGWNVFVDANGRIRVCDATQPTDPEPVFESYTA